MSATSSVCPFCNATVSTSELERHANDHFEDEELARDMDLAQQIAFSSPTSQSKTASNQVYHGDVPFENGFGNTPESILINAQIKSEFYKVEDGLIALLRKCLESESENSTSILSGYVDHFQSIATEDVGWGCGWRNIQMLSSYLLMQRQEARKVLFGGSGFVPDIESLQRWLEIAWERGFDMIGSNEFNHKIYGSRNWIGTTECAALFRSFGLRAMIVDFGVKEIESLSISGAQGRNASNKGKKKEVTVYGPMDKFLSRKDNGHPQAGVARHEKSISSSTILGENPACISTDGLATRKVKGQQVLVDWVWNYFSDCRPAKSINRVIVTEKSPLYFQHDGHSRTIVGIQAKFLQNGMQQYNLLILDPVHRTADLKRSLEENVGWQKLIKRGVHTLKKPQYQLCYIDSELACGEEAEQLKILDSTFFEF